MDAAVSVTGEVVEVGALDDPVVVVRVGSEMVMVEVPESRSHLSVDAYFSFRVDKVRLCPYTL
jgi:hypothetical protein